MMLYPYIYSTVGEWIGWVTPKKDVYNVHGIYVGWLTKEPRVLRRRVQEGMLARRDSPPIPDRIRPPATVPLPPMMAELPFEIVDVFDDDREHLTTLDYGEHKEDMD